MRVNRRVTQDCATSIITVFPQFSKTKNLIITSNLFPINSTLIKTKIPPKFSTKMRINFVQSGAQENVSWVASTQKLNYKFLIEVKYCQFTTEKL